MTSAERQRAFKKRMQEQGFAQVTAWVHESQVPDLMQLLAKLKENPDLVPGPVRNTLTNKFESIEKRRRTE